MKTKKILVVIVLLILLFPLFHKTFPFIVSGRLYGAITIDTNINFSWPAWWSGNYQIEKEKYFNTNVAFYPDFIRINNQIDYSLFTEMHENDVIEGGNKCLFDKSYLSAYNGSIQDEDNLVLNEALRIKKIQDELNKIGKKFVFVIAPNKSYYYPELIPSKYKREKSKTTKYERYLHLFDSLKINLIDFNDYFIHQKNTTKFPLITYQGIHWSSYGACVAADSLLKYLNAKCFDYKLNLPTMTPIASEKWNEHDQELLLGLNLIDNRRSKQITANPNYNFDKITQSYFPKTIWVSDSFLWEIMGQGIIHNVLPKFEFWYYNNSHWNGTNFIGFEDSTKKLSIKPIQEANVVIFMVSEFHMESLSSDFLTTLNVAIETNKK
jgi:hypothetical protein